MKSLDKAAAIAIAFCAKDDLPMVDVKKLIVSAQRKTKKLEEQLEAALDLLAKIRFQTWPEIGLGISLCPDDFDEIINEGERALRSCKR